MPDVTIYRTKFCTYCDMAERLLDDLEVDYDEVDVTHDAELREELEERTGMQTVPQIFIGDESIGGYDDLKALHDDGKLEEKLD